MKEYIRLDLKQWKQVVEKDMQVVISEEAFQDLRQRIRNACLFYYRYQADPEGFERKTGIDIIEPLRREWLNWKEHFKRWLFEYIFKDVLEDSDIKEFCDKEHVINQYKHNYKLYMEAIANGDNTTANYYIGMCTGMEMILKKLKILTGSEITHILLKAKQEYEEGEK